MVPVFDVHINSIELACCAALSAGVLASVDAWRAISADTGPDAWVFPSEKLTTPVAKDNCWRRDFLPRLKAVGLEWANFQVMRRTHSSLLKELDVAGSIPVSRSKESTSYGKPPSDRVQ